MEALADQDIDLDGPPRVSKMLSIVEPDKDPSRLTKPESLYQRRETEGRGGSRLTNNPRESEHSSMFDDGQMYVDVNNILGSTVTSVFGKKKKKQSFVNAQTVDYQQSIKLEAKDVSDGVSMRGHGERSSRMKNPVANSVDGKSHFNSISKKVEEMNYLHSQQISVHGNPLQGALDGVSFMSR